MHDFQLYRRRGVTEARPYVPGEDVTGVSISDDDRANGSPREGDWIARNPKNYADRWLIARAYFAAQYVPFDTE